MTLPGPHTPTLAPSLDYLGSDCNFEFLYRASVVYPKVGAWTAFWLPREFSLREHNAGFNIYHIAEKQDMILTRRA